jgi:hypothetical protein
MNVSQQISDTKNATPQRLTVGQRLLAGAMLPAEVCMFAFLRIAAVHKFVFYPWPCGFKTQFGLPCPTCGMTTSVLAFAGGDVWRSFYIQPAAAVLCCMLIAAGVFAMIAAIVGTDWGLVRSMKLKYSIVTFMIIISGGWAVTLSRAIAKSG